MAAFFEKHRRTVFYLILVIAFVMIYAYNFLTPYLSDDYAYLIDVRKAESLLDLIKQQYAEYLSNSARIIGQFNIRLSLLGSKQIFNIINSGMFLALILLMYVNIRRKKEYDIFVLLLILTFLWKFSVEFGQTMLWICGSCNYLWGSVIILAFLTYFRHLLQKAGEIKHQAGTAVCTFLFGLAAGWCNENTSGGGLLLLLLFSLNFWYQKKKEGRKPVYPFMLSGGAGMLCGLLGMVLSPGARGRSVVMAEDEYTGFVGLLSRTYKVIVNIRKLFFPLLAIMLLLFVVLTLQKKLKTLEEVRTNESVLFFIAFAATAFVLALIPTPADRAFFGAGVFLMIAGIQGMVDIKEEGITVNAVRYGLVSVLCLWLFFTYAENLVNLARIVREENERIALIDAEHGEYEDGIVVIPQYREEFKTPFSFAHDSDLNDDKEYWINHFYEVYYDIGNITAIPREEWESLYGGRSKE